MKYSKAYMDEKILELIFFVWLKRNKEIVDGFNQTIRNCPFCGGKAKLETGFSTIWFCYGVPTLFTRYSIMCEKECVDFRKKYMLSFNNELSVIDYPGPVDLVQKWNGNKDNAE